MIGRETRMLLRHYLEQGATKSALARQLGISRDSYAICRAIAVAAKKAGFAGLIYPSYFSVVRTGARPFDTAYGLSVRRFPSYREHARALSIPNVGLFGEPIREGTVRVDGVNRVLLRRVAYDVHFGPVRP